MDNWIPFARRYSREQETKGARPLGWPEGLIVHYSAGGNNPESLLEYSIAGAPQPDGSRLKLCFLVLDKTGQLWQASPLDRWGNHAGPSFWAPWGKSVSARAVGVEVISAGLLNEHAGGLWTAWGTPVDRTMARYVAKSPGLQSGFYEKFTPAQEERLAELCWWLAASSNGKFNLDFVLGHSEVATPPGRKVDPGGCLSRTMPEFRAYLKASYEERNG